MISIVTDEKEISNLYQMFIDNINKYFNQKIKCWVGYPGGRFGDNVSYSKEFNLWLSRTKLNSRLWNGFGIGKPIEGKNNSLAGEINFPHENINRAIAGAFGKDLKGNVFVLHRGRIGGGKKGVGKQAFIDNYRGEFITALDYDKETKFILIGELNSKYFPNQVADFIYEIKRIKQIINHQQPDFNFNDFSFTEQSSGKSQSNVSKVISQNRIHGIIVNALAKELENINYNVGNDRNRDLFIWKDNKILTLFEIKSSCSTQDIYSAIGQVIIYSIPIRNKVKLVVVLPDKLNTLVENKISEIGIHILYYSWVDNNIKFNNLNEIIIN